MFFVKAHMVKPVNRDDLPPIPNVESLKKGSLLGIDRKEGQIDGPTGFSTSGTMKSDATPASAPKTVPAVSPAGDGPKAVVPAVSSSQGAAPLSSAKDNP